MPINTSARDQLVAFEKERHGVLSSHKESHTRSSMAELVSEVQELIEKIWREEGPDILFLCQLAQTGQIGSLVAIIALRFLSNASHEAKGALLTIMHDKSHPHRVLVIHHAGELAQNHPEFWDALEEISRDETDPHQLAALSELSYLRLFERE